MIDATHIEQLANEHLEGTANYLVDVKVTRFNKVIITIDNDHGGINIKDCVGLSRYIESKVDREQEDYELEVSSHGIGEPLQLIRQYKKNQGRTVSVTTTAGKKIDGVMINVTTTDISVDEDFKDPITKKKSLRTAVIPYGDIKQTVVTITFK